MNSSFQQPIDQFLEVMGELKKFPFDLHNTPEWPILKVDAPVALGFWAHPDDETLTGGALAIRLRRAGYRVINVAMTLGEPDQVVRRCKELETACKHLGMEFLVPNKGRAFYQEVRKGKLQQDQSAIDEISEIIMEHNPKIILTHHGEDAHPDHEGVNSLVLSALQKTPSDLECILVEGEWWRDMSAPNLQLEVSKNDLKILLEAATCHKGEIEQNPYHVYLVLTAYLNNQYGYWFVPAGRGNEAASFDFSVMYRVRRFQNGRIISSFGPMQLAADKSITALTLELIRDNVKFPIQASLEKA